MASSPKRRLCVRCQRNRHEKFYSGPRGRVCSFCRKKRVSLASRDVRLMELYGITQAEYDVLLQAQGGVCAICASRRTYNLDVDHDHALERAGLPPRETLRGLCCKTCNRRLLKAAKDSVEILQAAIDYLNDPPARKVLSGTTEH